MLTLPRSARRGGYVYLPGEVTKNKKPVCFPDKGTLKEVLDEQEAYVRRIEKKLGKVIPHLFCHEDGRPIKSPEFAWKKACHAAQRPGLLIHDLKRSAVRQAERMGIDRDVFRDMAGIKTDSIYSRYNIGDEKRKDEAAEKLTHDRTPKPDAKAANV